MTNGERNGEGDAERPASLVDALLVYAEPLAAGAHVVVVGDAESPVADRLLELGARGVHVFDPDPARAANAARSAPRGVTVRALVDELEVRDGAFDLAVVPDLSELNDPRSTVARLQRAVSRSGAVVAMGRAKLDPAPSVPPFATDLGPAALGYDELYALFAASFDEVSLAGVVPFAGVVFAELGGDDESPAVSVDTRFAPTEAPSIFVVVARQDGAPGDRLSLDPYAIVQVTETETGTPRETTLALETAFAAAQLKSELLLAQLDETRDRLVVADVRTVEAAARLDRAAVERDGALTRAMELETILSSAQHTLAALERRLLETEQAVLEREERLAVFAGALEATRAIEVVPSVDIVELLSRAERAEAAFGALAERQDAEVDDLRARVEHAERAFAAQGADLAHVGDTHGVEMTSYEEQLRDRARLIAALEKELARREQLVLELVTSLEDAREGSAAPVFEASAPLSISPGPQIAVLERKLDALAAEVARREGELTARGWRITELENALAGRPAGSAESSSPPSRPIHDELDALRQALAQEHAARVAAESGEELVHARAELARQAALLDQMRGRPS